MGQFLESDEYYRNQFETKTSCGALDPENNTRHLWSLCGAFWERFLRGTFCGSYTNFHKGIQERWDAAFGFTCFFLLMCFSSLDGWWMMFSLWKNRHDRTSIFCSKHRFQIWKKIKHATLLLIWTSNLRLTSYSGTPTHRLVGQKHHQKIFFSQRPKWTMLRACQDGLGTHLVWWFIRQGQALWSLQVWCIECHQWLSRPGKFKGLGSGLLVGWPLGKGWTFRNNVFWCLGGRKSWNLSSSKVKG